jgi:hypothetical protein
MTSLLLINALLLLLAVRRGWRVAPFVFLALPRVLVELEGSIPELAFAGWVLPFANLLVIVGALSTLCMAYTAIADPEPA